MTHPVEIPFDIWEYIVDILGDTIDKESDAIGPLKALSLSCTAMAPLCRKYLFSTLCLDEDASRSSQFSKLISETPDIILYVRDLDYYISDPFDVHIHTILNMLKNRSLILQHIHLCSYIPDGDGEPNMTWDTLPNSLQVLLEQLIHLPSVTTLDFQNVKQVPATIFTGCTNLTSITLFRSEFILPSNIQQTWPASLTPCPVHLFGMSGISNAIGLLMEPRGPTKDHRIVDFSGLRELNLNIDSVEDARMAWDILQITTELQCLKLGPRGYNLLTGLKDALSTHAISTLKKLSVYPWISKENQDPLGGLVPELQLMARVNVLEEIHLHIIFCVEALSRPVVDDWSAFDLAITTSGSFKMLKRVRVEVGWQPGFTTEENVQTVLRADHFPRLLMSEEVEFSFGLIN